MEERKHLLETLQLAVATHNSDWLQKAIREAFEAGIEATDVRYSITSGLEQVRHKLMSNDVSIPDFLLCIDTMTDGLNKFPSLEIDQNSVESKPTLVIGVVEGDPHDIGKNIIAAIYRAHGYPVIDLGRNVSQKTFIKGIEENSAGILALSGMMSTTVTVMPDIIHEAKVKLPEIVVMIGGAPLDQTVANRFGADGYAENAVTVLEETEQAIKRIRTGTTCSSLNRG